MTWRQPLHEWRRPKKLSTEDAELASEHQAHVARKDGCRVSPINTSIVSTRKKLTRGRNLPKAISLLRSRRMQNFGVPRSYESCFRLSKSKLKSSPIGPRRFPVTESVVLPPSSCGAQMLDTQQASSLSPISECFNSIKRSADQTNSSGWAVNRKSRPIGLMPSADNLQFRRAPKFSNRRSGKRACSSISL